MRKRSLARWGLVLALVAYGYRRASVTDVPLCPATAGGRGFVGPDWVARRSYGTGDHPPGEMDDVEAFARPDFDPGGLDPAVRRFYERTADYGMVYRVRWHRPFRTGAAVAARLTSRIQQLNLPAPGDESLHRLESEFERVAVPGDPRGDVRAWTRVDPATGEAVFVALYGAHEHDGERYVNIGVPLPGANLSTVLRPEHDEDGGLRLTTRADGHPGLYLVTGVGTYRLPLDQEFRVWPTGGPGAPVAPSPDPDLVATHEMWFLGARFLTITYGIARK